MEDEEETHVLKTNVTNTEREVETTKAAWLAAAADGGSNTLSLKQAYDAAVQAHQLAIIERDKAQARIHPRYPHLQPAKRRISHGMAAIAQFLQKHLTQHDDSFQLWNVMNKSDREVVTLLAPLFGQEYRSSTLVWRDDYHKIMENIDTCLDRPQRGMLLTGNQGTGMSVLALCYVLRCVRRGDVVLYQYGNIFTFVYYSLQLPELVKQEFTRRGYSLPGPGVYTLGESDDDALRDALILHPGMILVQDIGDCPNSKVVRTGASSKWLLVAPPNSEVIDSPVCNAEIPIYVIKSWTEAELRLMKPVDFPEAKMLERIRRFGGVPRFVFGPIEVSQEGSLLKRITPELVLEGACNRVTLDDLVTALRGISYTSISKNVAGVLVNIMLAPMESVAICRIKIASDEIRERLVEKFLSDREIPLFLNMVWDVPELARHRGYVLETYVHKNLVKSHSAQLHVLGARTRSTKLKSLTLPGLSVRRFEAKDMMDLATLDLNEYARPWSKIFPSLDSFAVMNAKLFFADVKDGEWCIVAFHVTMSDKELPDSAILDDVHNRVCTLQNVAAGKEKDVKMALVFVTDANGIHTEQIIKTKTTDTVATFSYEIKQFALLLGNDFDEILKWEKERVYAVVTHIVPPSTCGRAR